MPKNEMPNYVKIFGRQKCGTSYTINMMKTNFVNTIGFNKEFGHKHDAPLSVEEMTNWAHLDDQRYKIHGQNWENIKNGNYIHPVIVIKNPYSWYWSAKRFWNNTDFEAVYNNFNNMYRIYREFAENGAKCFYSAYVARYEDLITLPVKEQFKKIADFFGLKMKDEFTDIRIACRGWAPFTEERRNFYLQDGDFGLSNVLIKKITGVVDWDLMKFYGYRPKE